MSAEGKDRRMSSQLSDESSGPTSSRLSRVRRSTADLILVAAHHACDLRVLEAADRLLACAEALLNPRDRLRFHTSPRTYAGLVADYERLWALKHEDG